MSPNPWFECASNRRASTCTFACIFVLLHYVFNFFKNVLPAAARSTFLKTNSEQSGFKNPLFGALNALNEGSVGHLFGTCRSFARSVRLFSASVAQQNFNFRLENVYFLFMSRAAKRQQIAHLRIYENFKYCCEFALNMFFARCIFDIFVALMHFVSIFLQKNVPRLRQKHIFENKL